MGKSVLDVCCGGKMFYFDKNTPDVVFCDIRTLETSLCDGRHFEVRPDCQCDFTALPFPNDCFKMVVFDPPHLKGKSEGWQKIKYGWLGDNYEGTLAAGFSECFRVLESGGFLIFKWNETNIPVSKILRLTPHKPLFGNKCGKHSKTHWICFVKGV